jgi:WD40 repeat protein
LHSVRISNYAHSGSAVPGTSAGSFALSVALAPGDRYLASGYAGGNVFISDLDNHWKTVAMLPASYGAANAVAWSADGQYLAVGYANNIAVVYNVNSQALAFNLNHQAAVNSVAWNTSSGSYILASGAADGTVSVWNLGAATPVQTVYTRNTKSILSVAWNGSGQLASASQDQTVTIWQPRQ